MITFTTLKFESFQCCVHLTRLITQTQLLHIFHFSYICLGSLLYTMELRQFSKTCHYYTHSQLIEHWPTLASFRSTTWFTILKNTLSLSPYFLMVFAIIYLYATSTFPKFPTATLKFTNTTTFMNKAYKNTQIISKLITRINWTLNKQNKWIKHNWINEWPTNLEKLLKHKYSLNTNYTNEL